MPDNERIERAEQYSRERRRELHKLAGMPERFRDCIFDDFKVHGDETKRVLETVKGYANDFDDVLNTGRCMVMMGVPGTGKSMLCCCLANAIINKTFVEYKLSSTYIDEHDLVEHTYLAIYKTEFSLLSKIKRTWRYDSEKTDIDVINKYSVPELLIVDEVGLSCNTDGDKNLLYQVINARYEKRKPTVIISNLIDRDLKAYCGERVIDRLKENGGVQVIFNWNSYRR